MIIILQTLTLPQSSKQSDKRLPETFLLLLFTIYKVYTQICTCTNVYNSAGLPQIHRLLFILIEAIKLDKVKPVFDTQLGLLIIFTERRV